MRKGKKKRSGGRVEPPRPSINVTAENGYVRVTLTQPMQQFYLPKLGAVEIARMLLAGVTAASRQAPEARRAATRGPIVGGSDG